MPTSTMREPSRYILNQRMTILYMGVTCCRFLYSVFCVVLGLPHAPQGSFSKTYRSEVTFCWSLRTGGPGTGGRCCVCLPGSAVGRKVMAGRAAASCLSPTQASTVWHTAPSTVASPPEHPRLHNFSIKQEKH